MRDIIKALVILFLCDKARDMYELVINYDIKSIISLIVNYNIKSF